MGGVVRGAAAAGWLMELGRGGVVRGAAAGWLMELVGWVGVVKC